VSGFFSSIIQPAVSKATSSLTRAVTNKVKSAINGQIMSTVGAVTKQTVTVETITRINAEVGAKLTASNIASSFKNLSSGVSLTNANGVITAVQDGTGSVIGSIGTIPSSDVAASLLDGAASGNLTDSLKVKIVASPAIGDVASNTVIFDVMPSIDEGRSASYDSIELLHHPGKIMKYHGTDNRSWRVTADLVSRTVEEADKNQRIMNLVRSWVMPFYGTGTAAKFPDKLGAPPQILTLTGLGPRMIGPATCVLTNYGWVFENERDYIRTSDNVPFPVHLKVSLDLVETWSPAEFSKFDLDSYRSGDLGAAFGNPTLDQTSSSATTDATSTAPSAIDVTQLTSATNSALATASNAANQFVSSIKSDLKSQLQSQLKTTAASLKKSTVSSVKGLFG
jgi:hypothetical protein